MWYGKGFNDGPDEPDTPVSNAEARRLLYLLEEQNKRKEKENDNFSMTGSFMGWDE